ncbi:MAG: hypothetical protein AMXMBFR67_16020 [Nitrospira sp.]
MRVSTLPSSAKALGTIVELSKNIQSKIRVRIIILLLSRCEWNDSGLWMVSGLKVVGERVCGCQSSSLLVSRVPGGTDGVWTNHGGLCKNQAEPND